MIRYPRQTLAEFLRQGPYVGYSYSYPHKTAYRPFPDARPLGELWSAEPQGALFLYVHVPFCEYRCGFCNLLTLSQPDADLPGKYLDTLALQARAIRAELPEARFSRLAIGGGTPSFLNLAELERLFALLRDGLAVDGQRIPVSFEASPSTLDADKLRLAREFGVDRLSLGIQSFSARDVAGLGRPQRNLEVQRALDLIRAHDFATLNIDLIYGGEQQTLESWIETVRAAVERRPEEMYLYPLYVRPLTGLARLQPATEDLRPELYRAGRDLLLDAGYEQVSMRMFQLPRHASQAVPDYSCQRDGMLGLGCGARSYTRTCHYGSTYAVKQASIVWLIQDFIRLDEPALRAARHGIDLDENERRRRFLILSLLLVEGLDCPAYAAEFGSEPWEHLPQLSELCEHGLALLTGNQLQLTAQGLAWSDAIGPWLYSDHVRSRMAEFPWID